MTRHQSIASVLAVIAALLVTNLIVQGSRPAEAGGAAGLDPCPPDLDGDGVVAVPDLLQVLAAWGPCPGPPLVVAAGGGSNRKFRVWSDGTLQFMFFELNPGGCLLCELTPFVFNWLDVGATPIASRPVDLTANSTHVFIDFADGSTWYRLWATVAIVDPACAHVPGSSYCDFEWVGEWIELP